jgi:opacity protein-like surface antigen
MFRCLDKKAGSKGLVFFLNLAACSAYATESSWNHSALRDEQSLHPTGTGDQLVGFQLGPSVGTSTVSVSEGSAPHTDSRTRSMLGAYYEYRFAGYLSIRPELNYVQRGFSQASGQVPNAILSEVSANYFEVPLMVKAHYEIDAFEPYVLTGPFLGLLIGKGVSTTQGNHPSQESSLDHEMNTLDLGWNIGAGSSYAITKIMSADLGLRYSMGLSNAYSTVTTGGSVSATLNAFQVLAGLGFAI